MSGIKRRQGAEELAAGVLEGSEPALARLISLVENNPACMSGVLPVIQPHLGRAHCIGFTGPPGAGKSSLVNHVTRLLREKGHLVGIIAVDPTSPFSGGALLGDRIRMQGHYLDPGVFIRSMATRDNYGGLAGATSDVVKLMDAFGMDYVLVETVGVGQIELDVMHATDTVVVILVPEGGDSVQLMKAGLMEIGDIFAVNKSDRPGAGEIALQLQVILQMNARYAKKIPPVIQTQSIDGLGADTLVEAIKDHRLDLNGEALEARRRERRNLEFEEAVAKMVIREWRTLVEADPGVRARLDRVIDGRSDPYSVIREIFDRGIILGKKG